MGSFPASSNSSSAEFVTKSRFVTLLSNKESNFPLYGGIDRVIVDAEGKQIVPEWLTSNVSESNFPLYGRIDRVIVDAEGKQIVPEWLTSRPTKRVGFEKPLCFFMGPEALLQLPTCKSLDEILSRVIALDDSTIEMRLGLVKESKLDHVLLLCSPAHDGTPMELANLEGMHSLLIRIHPGASARFARTIPHFKVLIGEDREQFERRKSVYSIFWKQWHHESHCMWIDGQDYPNCGCTELTFDSYCNDFDAMAAELDAFTDATPDDVRFLAGPMLLTRRMLMVFVGCNELYGFDGHTYNADGHKLDKEYLTVNAPMTSATHGAHDEPGITYSFLSEMPNFQVVKTVSK